MLDKLRTSKCALIMNFKWEIMNRIILLSIVIIGMIGCEKGGIIIPPDDPELFTDITYEATSIGAELTPDVTYGSWTYSLPNYPDSLVWQELRAEDVLLPWTKTVSTCKGHPVSMGAIVTGKDMTMTFNIYDKDVLVATETFESNGLLWGGNLEYNIPNP
jgi:hypothetical protein